MYRLDGLDSTIFVYRDTVETLFFNGTRCSMILYLSFMYYVLTTLHIPSSNGTIKALVCRHFAIKYHIAISNAHRKSEIVTALESNVPYHENHKYPYYTSRLTSSILFSLTIHIFHGTYSILSRPRYENVSK